MPILEVMHVKGSPRWSKTVNRLSHRSDPGVGSDPAPSTEAQRRTEAVLDRLPTDSWSVVLHNCRDGVDHVAVGPGGVYLIASHQPQGCVRVKDGVPWLRRGDDPGSDRPSPALQRKVADPARHLQREIRDVAGQTATVHAVVVLWSEFPQRVAETSQVAYVHGRNLAGWLQGRAQELGDGARAPVVDALRQVEGDHRRRTPRISRRHAA